MYQWNEEHKCLCDYMGYPLSRSDALALRDCVRLHLKHSPADLAELANKEAERTGTTHTTYRAESFQ